MKWWQMILVRYCGIITAYFFLSLAYTLVPLAFQINFSGGNPVTSHTQVTSTINGNSNPDLLGHATFVVLWMLNWVGMMALGLACENAAMVLGQPWTGLFLIAWVIVNVCTAFYDIDLEPGIYRYGYAMPLHSGE